MKWFFLDACSLLNLFASGRLSHMARDLGLTYLVLPIVYPEESQFVYIRDGLQQGQPKPLDLTLELQSGLVQIAPDLDDTEKILFIQLANAGIDGKPQIDDGEAKTAAAAIARGHGLITDDKKALRIVREVYPEVSITTSHALLRQWIEQERIDASEAREVLLNLEIGGNFKIGKNHPEWAWTQQILGAKM